MSRGTARWDGKVVSPSKDDRGVEVGGASAREALLGRLGLPARTREAQPRFAFPQRTWEIRANPRPMRVSGQSPDHNGEGRAL